MFGEVGVEIAFGGGDGGVEEDATGVESDLSDCWDWLRGKGMEAVESFFPASDFIGVF